MVARNSRPLHVLVARPYGQGGRGGIDRLMDLVAEALAEQQERGVVVHLGTTRGAGHLFWSPYFLIRFLLSMFSLNARRQAVVVHINLAPHGSIFRKAVIAGASRMLGLPYVLHLHGSAYDEYYAVASTLERRLAQATFRQAAKVLVLGQKWYDFVVAADLAGPEDVEILPNASRSRPAPRSHSGIENIRILFLGTLGKRKGVPELIEALGEVSHLSWTATLAGNGDIEEAESALARLGLRDRISLPGWVGPGEVDDLLSNSDILVLPSHAENLPMSVVEAMAAGLAIVTTPVGATRDLIDDGKTGLIVPVGDIHALAAALGQLISDEKLRAKLGRGAFLFHRKNLGISGYAKELVDLWQRVERTSSRGR